MVFRWLLYPAGKLLAVFGYWLFGPTRIEGRENVPRRGGLLVCANHISDADPALMFRAVPRPVWFMAKSEIFGIRFIGWVARLYRSFPVHRGAPDRAALRRAEQLLAKGECVVMFPEGRCSESGKLQPLLPGVAMILQRAKVPCVCAGIRGSNKTIPYGEVWPRRAGGITVRFGRPYDFSAFTGRPGIDRIVRALTEELARLAEQPVPDALEQGRRGAPLDDRQDLDAAT
jgi:1-acyl-sn-glycerol-3-phosphate acyltransferase